eukprot:gene9966-18582_t
MPYVKEPMIECSDRKNWFHQRCGKGNVECHQWQCKCCCQKAANISSPITRKHAAQNMQYELSNSAKSTGIGNFSHVPQFDGKILKKEQHFRVSTKNDIGSICLRSEPPYLLSVAQQVDDWHFLTCSCLKAAFAIWVYVPWQIMLPRGTRSFGKQYVLVFDFQFTETLTVVSWVSEKSKDLAVLDFPAGILDSPNTNTFGADNRLFGGADDWCVNSAPGGQFRHVAIKLATVGEAIKKKRSSKWVAFVVGTNDLAKHMVLVVSILPWLDEADIRLGHYNYMMAREASASNVADADNDYDRWDLSGKQLIKAEEEAMPLKNEIENDDLQTIQCSFDVAATHHIKEIVDWQTIDLEKQPKRMEDPARRMAAEGEVPPVVASVIHKCVPLSTNVSVDKHLGTISPEIHINSMVEKLKQLYDITRQEHVVLYDLSRKSKHFQVNDRLQVATYEIGCHYEAARNFCANMDLPPPVSFKPWNKKKARIHEAFKAESSKSKNKAASEVKVAKGDDVTVSCDGTWQKRGFASKNGVVTVATVNRLSSKIIDTETLTNDCNKLKATTNGNETAHKCQKNYEGTAGSMEGEGVKRIFKRSQQQYGLSYVGYLGDGDSKSFKNLSEAVSPIYQGKQIEKLEYVGHIQKRMGRKLSNLVFKCKNKIFINSDGKKVKRNWREKEVDKKRTFTGFKEIMEQQ